ncbi:MAG: uncharacterized protein QOG64_361 [Acidimicrobiaceae bacterium]|nr:uncharacterized protein [Acidimicrobiaceae bacterium]
MENTADLIVGARRSAGMTQAELARRAGIPRQVLNVYERGRRQPGAETLAHIVDAAGRELRSAPALRRLDEKRASRVLLQVLELAEELPFRRRRTLPVSPFRAIAR